MATDRAGWVSVRAVLWVLDEAHDVPPQLVAPLIGLARHADEDGANAYPSQSTLARYTRKTDRQVKKDLALLLDLGLIRKPLDQSAATGLRADRRPTVYDLGCAPMRAHGGNYTTGRPVPGGTTRRVVQGRTGGTPGSNGVSSSSPEESLNNPEQPLKKELQDLGGSVPVGQRSRPTAAALAGTAHSVAAHRLVENYAGTCRRRPPTSVLTDVAVQVDTLLGENWTPEELTPAIAAWGAKGLHPKALPSVAHEIANRAPDGGQSQFAPRPSTTDQRVAAVQALKAQFASNGSNVLQLPSGDHR